MNGIAVHRDGLAESQAASSTQEEAGVAPVEQFPLEPEIIRESGGLRASDFFSARMWVLALIPILSASIISQFSAVRYSEAPVLLWGGQIYEDTFFQPAGIGWFASHLLPFGIPMSVDVGYGQEYLTIYLATSIIAGVLSLLFGFLLVISYTRNSNDGVYACGPYAAYSLIAVLLQWKIGPYYDGLRAIFPALFAALVMPVFVAAMAKLCAVAMRNAGMIEIDEGLMVFEDETQQGSSATATLALPVQAEAKRGRKRKAKGGDGLFEASVEQPTLSAPVVERNPVARAVVCPYCGSHRQDADKPGPCAACHKNLALAFEWSNGERCHHCQGILVRDSAFCHHCGKWQRGGEEPDVEKTDYA